MSKHRLSKKARQVIPVQHMVVASCAVQLQKMPIKAINGCKWLLLSSVIRGTFLSISQITGSFKLWLVPLVDF